MANQHPGVREVPELLQKARRLIDGGQPRLALQAVITALRLQGVSVTKIYAALESVRLQHRQTIEEDDLSALLAHCALAEASDDRSIAIEVPQQRKLSPLRSSLSRFSRGGPESDGASPSEAHRDGHDQPMSEATSQASPQNITDHSNMQSQPPIGSSPGDLCNSGTSRFVLGFSSYPCGGVIHEMRESSIDQGPNREPTGWASNNWQGGVLQPSSAEAHALKPFPALRTSAADSVPILAEMGKLQVVQDASSDGSSFTCPRCLGVVALMRHEEHYLYWCSS